MGNPYSDKIAQSLIKSLSKGFTSNRADNNQE